MNSDETMENNEMSMIGTSWRVAYKLMQRDVRNSYVPQ